MVWVVVGGIQDFSVSPSPLGTNWVSELIGTWLGLSLGGLGTKGLGTVLDNYQKNQKKVKISCDTSRI